MTQSTFSNCFGVAVQLRYFHKGWVNFRDLTGTGASKVLFPSLKAHIFQYIVIEKQTLYKLHLLNFFLQYFKVIESFQAIMCSKTRADTAQTHGPPRSVKISFRTCCSLPTAVPGLRPGWDMFVLVCSVRWWWVTPLQGGVKTMAWLTLGPW